MRFRLGRRWIVLGAIVAGVGMLAAIGLWVVYPRVGEWYVRSRVVPRLERKLGVKIKPGSIDVSLGHATMRGLEVISPVDGAQPLAHLDRIEIDFATWPSFVGKAKVGEVAIHGGTLAVHRAVDGSTNLDLLRARFTHGPRGADRSGGGLGSLKPKRIIVDGLVVTAHDATGEIRAGAAGLSVRVEGSERELVIDKPVVETVLGPRAGAARITVREHGDRREVLIVGGEATPWKGMSLTGIAGTLSDGDQPGHLQVALEGGYGGVEAGLWTAHGWVDPVAGRGQIALVAEQFSLDKLRPLIEARGRRLVDYQKTMVDAALTITLDGPRADAVGNFHLRDLTVAHPMLAEQPVRGLELSGDVAGSFDCRARVLALTRGDFESRGLPFSFTGEIYLPGGVTAGGGRRPRPAVAARLRVAPVACQRVLDALPREMATYIADLEAKGTFSSDVQLAIDWADLDATVLDGSVGLRGCRIAKLPAAISRLQGPFEHFVEVERDQWVAFTVGLGEPGFVPLAELSAYLPKALMTTEDSSFYSHHGFLPREFKAALVKNLKAGYFKYGASSITMQTVKNVLLYREKTLSRKLQELVLTWAIEQALDKDRIMEIYVNAIEYGPGLYGIGNAAQHYFGKSAGELTAKESAFFSSILPSPKARYRQYCNGTLTSWSEDKIERILATMLKRGRLTQEELDLATATPLVFVKDVNDSEEACNERVARAMKHARPTNPHKR